MRGKNRKRFEKQAKEIFDSLPHDMKTYLIRAAEVANSKEEFVRLTMVGDCPKCGSSKTRDCEHSPLDDPTVGICLECYTLWCLECGEVFQKGQTGCEHWSICAQCDFSKHGECNIPPFECSIIREWTSERQ